MVRKEVCPNCRGNKWVSVPAPNGQPKHVPCPHCSGSGYRVRVVHLTR